MSFSTLITDDYDRRARLRPALLVGLPLVLAVVSLFSDFSGMHFLVGFLAYFGFTALIAQLGRDEGKRLEPWLFEHWGGKPTTQVLRHRDSHLDMNTKERYHMALSGLLPLQSMPSATSEATHPGSADAAYDSCVLFLRDRTRDRMAFPLVYAENVNYGFRRNLWGMKKAGAAISTCALLATVLLAILRSKSGIPPALPVAASVINACMLVWWLLRITPEWVGVPAFAYAERLLATCDALHQPYASNRAIITTAD